MEKRAFRSKLCRSIVLLLPIILVLGVLPCAAQEPPTLQDLIEGKTIQVDNLTFSGFQLDTNFAFPTSEIKPQPENITVEPVGQGTTFPGLKFIPNFQLAVQPDSGSAYFFVKKIGFSYQVTADDGSGLIAASALILNPGTVEPEGDSAAVLVEDVGGQMDNSVYQSKSLDSTSGEYMLEETLRVETNLSPTSSVSPGIIVGLSVSKPGGEASIESFEQRFTLAPAPGGPMADAGPDQAVFDQVSLDGSGSSPSDAKYKWELYRKDGDELVLVGEQPSVQAEFSNLDNGFYEARLIVEVEGISAVDTAFIAAAGPSGVGTEPKIQETELNLWHFELKKYKYCKWSIARMLGTFDLPDDLEFNRGDELVGKVTVQINRGDDPLVVMSDDLKLKVKNWKYKSVIHGH